MNAVETLAGYALPADDAEAVTLPARPEPLRLKASETALIVVDMQNAYASQGGYLDLAGFDVSATGPVIENVAAVVETARVQASGRFPTTWPFRKAAGCAAPGNGQPVPGSERRPSGCQQ